MLHSNISSLLLGEIRLYRINRQHYVFVGRHPGQERIALEYHHPVWSRLFDWLAMQQNLATGGLGKSRHHIE